MPNTTTMGIRAALLAAKAETKNMVRNPNDTMVISGIVVTCKKETAKDAKSRPTVCIPLNNVVT
jgi:hypothetical protein